MLDDAGDIVLCGDKQRVPRGISECLFMIRNETDSKVEEFRIEKVSEFAMWRQQSMNEMMMSQCHVYVKPNGTSCDFVRLKSVLKTQHVFKRETPLRISASFKMLSADRRRGSRASVQIRCSPDIENG